MMSPEDGIGPEGEANLGDKAGLLGERDAEGEAVLEGKAAAGLQGECDTEGEAVLEGKAAAGLQGCKGGRCTPPAGNLACLRLRRKALRIAMVTRLGLRALSEVEDGAETLL
jgi:hypothetical protein